MVTLVLENVNTETEIFREEIPPNETDLTPQPEDVITVGEDTGPFRVIQRRVDLDGIDEIRLLVRPVAVDE